MKNFTANDVVNRDSSFPRLYVDRNDLVDAPLAWQALGLQPTRSGYGTKAMREKISYCGRLYRLYATCYSNAGSVWFKCFGKKIYIS